MRSYRDGCPLGDLERRLGGRLAGGTQRGRARNAPRSQSWLRGAWPYLSRVVGSPKRIQVRRTFGSRATALAWATASPRVILALSPWRSLRFMSTCSAASLSDEEAHTATAPP